MKAKKKKTGAPTHAKKTKTKTKTVAAQSVPKTYCVVCPTWEIKRPQQCSNTLKSGAKTLYFCTKRCQERFAKAPDKFL